MNYEKEWSFPVFDPVCTDAFSEPSKPYGFLITQIIPKDGGVRVSWQSIINADEYQLIFTPYGNHLFLDLPVLRFTTKDIFFEANGLQNDFDYDLVIEAYKDGVQICHCLERRLRCHPVPGTVVSYIHPDDYAFSYSGRSVATPSILRLPSGTILAAHDVYWADYAQNLTKLFASHDNGNSWQSLCDLSPCFWGKLFYHRDAVYMLACSGEYGDLLLGCSTDDGRTWSPPTVLCKGGSRRIGGPHRSAVSVLEHRGRLWTSVDIGSHTIGGHDTATLSVSFDADLMNPSEWTLSAALKYNPDWAGGSVGATRSGYIEGSVILGDDGELYNILRYETRAGTPNYGLAPLLKIDTENPSAAPIFCEYIKFHGNLSKFSFTKDNKNGWNYAVVSRVDNEPTYYRGRLSLMRSMNLRDWQFVADLLDINKLTINDGDMKTAFQYPDTFLENGILYLLSRSAIGGAYNYHNANYITFHTFDLTGKEVKV